MKIFRKVLKIAGFKRKPKTLRKIPSIARLSLDYLLIPELQAIKSEITLDIGSKDSPYKKYLNTKHYFSTDYEYNSSLSFVSDIYALPVKKNSVDFVLCTEVLEHLEKPADAINELYRILKKDGTCILTTRFMFPYHPDPKDFYRYTCDSLKLLFSSFESVQIISHGSRFQMLLYILTYHQKFRRILFPVLKRASRNNPQNTNFSFGFIVKAKKYY